MLVGCNPSRDSRQRSYPNIFRLSWETSSPQVKEESSFRGQPSDFVKTKLLTRLTYTLTGMTGKAEIGPKGTVKLVEEDGIDFAPTTVKLPGGELVRNAAA